MRNKINAALGFPRRIVEMQREMRLMHRQLTLPAFERRASAPQRTDATIFPQSSLCRQVDFEQAWYSHWVQRIHEAVRYHRKQWEFAFICQALFERGLLADGRRGLGFGVGTEPLPALFASHGAAVLATDQGSEAGRRSGWTSTRQHAAGVSALRRPDICEPAAFDRLVSFRECDMNAVPADLTGFDFCWSACALEHLGSIEKGLGFIERSLDCLKPGGVAVHTTEFNLSPLGETLEKGPTVLFRGQDLAALAGRLAAKGGHMVPLNLDQGDQPLDRYIDFPPYLDEPHLKLALSGYPSTSVGLIFVRGG